MRLLPLVAIAAILAGCGAISEDEYIARVTKASETVQQAMEGVSPDALRLEEGSRAIAHAADDLDGAHPPGKDKRLNEEVVGGFRKLADSLQQAAQAARRGEFAKRDDILGHLDKSPGMRQLNAAIAEIDRLAG